MYVYECVKPGYVYNFTKKRGDYYQCMQCRKLKIRKDAVVVGAKHPPTNCHQPLTSRRALILPRRGRPT